MNNKQNIFNEWGEDNFTVISNELIAHPDLSAKAKGILIYLLSKPSDWEVYALEIEKHFTEKIDAIYSGLSELEEKGYIVREQTREKGRFSNNEWKVYSSPTYKESLSNNTSTVTEFTVNGKTVNGKSQTTNTDSTKTNNTNISKDIEDNSSYKKEYGNPDIILIRNVLIDKYPKEIQGISDNNMLWSLVKVCGPRKGKDEWMDKDWKVNFATFLKEYLKETDSEYVVRSVRKLKDLVKDWRERGGPKKAPKFVQVG